MQNKKNIYNPKKRLLKTVPNGTVVINVFFKRNIIIYTLILHKISNMQHNNACNIII